MPRIKKILTQEEFEDVCKAKGMNSLEITKRYDNYLMLLSNGFFDRTASEVGANIKQEDLEEWK